MDRLTEREVLDLIRDALVSWASTVTVRMRVVHSGTHASTAMLTVKRPNGIEDEYGISVSTLEL